MSGRGEPHYVKYMNGKGIHSFRGTDRSENSWESSVAMILTRRPKDELEQNTTDDDEGWLPRMRLASAFFSIFKSLARLMKEARVTSKEFARIIDGFYSLWETNWFLITPNTSQDFRQHARTYWLSTHLRWV